MLRTCNNTENKKYSLSQCLIQTVSENWEINADCERESAKWLFILTRRPEDNYEEKPSGEEALRLLSCQSVAARLTSGAVRDEDGFLCVLADYLCKVGMDGVLWFWRRRDGWNFDKLPLPARRTQLSWAKDWHQQQNLVEVTRRKQRKNSNPKSRNILEIFCIYLNNHIHINVFIWTIIEISRSLFHVFIK